MCEHVGVAKEKICRPMYSGQQYDLSTVSDYVEVAKKNRTISQLFPIHQRSNGYQLENRVLYPTLPRVVKCGSGREIVYRSVVPTSSPQSRPRSPIWVFVHRRVSPSIWSWRMRSRTISFSEISKFDCLYGNLGPTYLRPLVELPVFVDDIYAFGYLGLGDTVSREGTVLCTASEGSSAQNIFSNILRAVQDPLEYARYIGVNILHTLALDKEGALPYKIPSPRSRDIQSRLLLVRGISYTRANLKVFSWRRLTCPTYRWANSKRSCPDTTKPTQL